MGGDDTAYNGYYDHTGNAIWFSSDFLRQIENKLQKKGKKGSYAKLEFIQIFMEEYTHYGDAIDGLDLEISPTGQLYNNPESVEPCEPDCKFDEGAAARGEIFKFSKGNGRQYYYLFKFGQLIGNESNTDGSPKIIELRPELQNVNMVPEEDED